PTRTRFTSARTTTALLSPCTTRRYRTRLPSSPRLPIADGSITGSAASLPLPSKGPTDLSSAPTRAASFRTAIVNIGTMVSGDWRRPFVEGDTLICENGRIAFIGKGDADQVAKADVVIDANGT